MHANRHAHKDEWTVNLVRECLHASDLAADPQLLAVVELLAPPVRRDPRRAAHGRPGRHPVVT